MRGNSFRGRARQYFRGFIHDAPGLLAGGIHRFKWHTHRCVFAASDMRLPRSKRRIVGIDDDMGDVLLCKSRDRILRAHGYWRPSNCGHFRFKRRRMHCYLCIDPAKTNHARLEQQLRGRSIASAARVRNLPIHLRRSASKTAPTCGGSNSGTSCWRKMVRLLGACDQR